jgi:hypothetical protein
MAEQSAEQPQAPGPEAPERAGGNEAPGRGEPERATGERPGQERGDQPDQGGQEEQADVPGPRKVADLGQPYLAEQATGIHHQGAMHGGQNIGLVHTLNANTYHPIVVPHVGGDRVAVGTVEPELLAKVRAVLVPPPVAGRALRVLRDQRVVVLQGRSHWGKASLALWLLSQVDGDGGPWPEVHAIAPDTSLRELTEECFSDETRPDGRYVIDTLDPAAAGSLRLPVLRTLCSELGKGYLVVTVDGRTPVPRNELGGYLVRCEELPAAEAVLRGNLRWRLDGQAPPERLLEAPWVRHELDRGALPGHLDQLAEVLAGVCRGTVEEAAAEAAYAGWARLRVQEWFESHPGLPQRCLMVAAAVLNGVSYHEVADAAIRLQATVEPPDPDEDRPRPPGWGLTSSRDQLVEDVGARIDTELRPTSLGPCRVEVLELEDPGLQRTVLDHVWEGHDAVRGELLDWLLELGHDGNLQVSGRAAAAVGALCRKDLPYLWRRVLAGWATSPRTMPRVSAAVALDVVARDPELAGHVRALLRRWVEDDPRSRLAWTATAAYGFHVGQRWPLFALRDLRLVVEEVPHHRWVASRSLVNLCEAGKAVTVLDKLADWAAVDDPAPAGLPALDVFTRMLGAGVDADALAAGTGADGERIVPTMLRLAATDDAVRARVVRLWKQAFARVETQERAVVALADWVVLADRREEVADALDVVAVELLGGSRSHQDQVAEVLRQLADDPRRPSGTARRYLQSIGQEVAY